MDWNQMVADYHKSGMTGSAFARSRKVSVSAFFYHLDKARKAAKATGKKSRTNSNGHTNGHHKNGFIDLTAQAMIEIETKGGTIVRLPQSIDAQKLKEIVEALQ